MAAAVAFDPSTAKPAVSTGGFDPSTAAPVAEAPIVIPPSAPAIDYDKGLPFTDRVALSSADTAEEKRFYLEKVYGKDNVKVIRDDTPDEAYGGGAKRTGPKYQIATSKDTLAVRTGGKWRAAEGGGALTGVAADIVSTSPELIMMGAGALAGTAEGPVGTLAGGAAGAMAGKTMEEGIKAITGRYHKSPEQYAAGVVQSGEAAIAGEVGGATLNRAVGRVMTGKLPKALTGTTEEAADRFRRLKAEGARPPISSIAPDLKKLHRMEVLAQKVAGEPTSRNQANKAVADKLATRVLVNGGLDKASAKKALVDMASGHEALPTGKVGEAIQMRIKAHQEMLEKQANDAMAVATDYVDTQAKHFNALIARHPAGALGIDVGEGIESSHKAFSKAADKVYGRVDSMLGNRPVVSITPLQRTANRLLAGAKEVSPTPLAKQISKVKTTPATPDSTTGLFQSLVLDVPTDGRITLGQAQRIRTILREHASSPDRTPGVTKHELGVLADTVDRAIGMAAVDPANTAAIKLLRQADNWYGATIKKFNDVRIHQLAARVKETGFTADPSEIARLVVTSGETARAEEIRKLVGPETWKRVAAQDVSNLIQDARDPLTGEVSGTSLAGVLKDRGGLMTSVHGETETKRMFEFARNLAATQGKLTAEDMTEPGFKAIMKEYYEARAGLEDFVKKDPVAALANSKSSATEIYNILTDPGRGELLAKVAKAVGPNSPEMHDLQKTALQKLLFDSMYEVGQVGPGKSHVTSKVGDVLRKYTKAQQDLLFPNDLVGHMRQFSEDLHFMFPKVTDDAMASMAAGSILDKPAIQLGLPKFMGGKGLVSGRWLLQVEYNIGRYLIDHPGVQEYLAVGRPRGPNAARNDEIRRNFVRFFALDAAHGVFDEEDAQ